MKIIARIYNDYTRKFGVPRQSGIIDAPSKIVFEPEYRVKEALRGLEGFSHLWLIWKFSLSEREEWSPTIRPPRLGGNARVGVFATRSPYRPNPIGLSSVRLSAIDYDTPQGAVLYVAGADLVNGTPIYDIKPYLAYTDCHPEASDGFAAEARDKSLRVIIPDDVSAKIGEARLRTLTDVLALDPRPAYHGDERVYGMSFADMNIKFRVKDGTVYVISAE